MAGPPASFEHGGPPRGAAAAWGPLAAAPAPPLLEAARSRWYRGGLWRAPSRAPPSLSPPSDSCCRAALLLPRPSVGAGPGPRAGVRSSAFSLDEACGWRRGAGPGWRPLSGSSPTPVGAQLLSGGRQLSLRLRLRLRLRLGLWLRLRARLRLRLLLRLPLEYRLPLLPGLPLLLRLRLRPQRLPLRLRLRRAKPVLAYRALRVARRPPVHTEHVEPVHARQRSDRHAPWKGLTADTSRQERSPGRGVFGR